VLILVTMGLVAVAAVALTVGFVSNHLGPIYLSIVCSALAGMVLLLFTRLGRRSTPVALGAGAAPLAVDLTTAFQSRLSSSPRVGPSSRTPGTAMLPTPSEHEDFADLDGRSRYGGWAEAPLFPIEDYDDLRVADILPLLGELDPEELEEVREREAGGRARATVLTRIRQLSGELEAVSESTAKTGSAAAKTETTGIRRSAAPPFPIIDYDRLRAAEIVTLLAELDDAELEVVAARELAGANRTTILSRIEKLLGRSVQGG
jgi:hypothetical protein